MSDDPLWRLERRLWLEGPETYRTHLDPACLMAFAQVGVLTGPAILESLEQAPRWDQVEMEQSHLTTPTDSLAVLAYRASARRGAQTYQAWCTSTWRRDGEAWRLVQHQQSPL